MSQIIKIDGSEIYIGDDDNGVVKAPIATVNYANPQVGDNVTVFQDGDTMIVARVGAAAPVQASPQSQGSYSGTSSYVANEKRINKHVFVWVASFLLCGIGLDRFLRGQIGMGILKIITVGGFGIWALVDWIVAMSKAYGSAFGAEQDIVFINGKYAR
ncbi:MAG: TM2 domain-containing protein [Eubacteriales bacterium]|nr:TM2 domain-containing protein [Eubacteriales bacterium]